MLFRNLISSSIIILLINLILIINGQIIDVYDRKIFIEKTDPKIYDLNLYPQKLNKINVGLKLINFGPIDLKKSQFTISLYLYIWWNDRRLSIKNQKNNSTQNNDNHLSILDIDYNDLSRIWKPELYFSNSIPFQSNILSDKLLGQLFGTIDSNGKIFIIKKTQINANCKINLKFYPMDKQKCFIEIESNKLTSRILQLKWMDQQPIDFIDNNNNLQWENLILNNYFINNGQINYLNLGPYERLSVTFVFYRNLSYYLFNIYLISIIIVISSWSSFWIHINAAPARVALVLTTMLTHVTLTKSIINDQLSSKNFKFISSLNIWIIICELFIFATIIEYSTVNYFYTKSTRIQDKKYSLQKQQQQQNNNSANDINNLNFNNNKTKKTSLWHDTWQKIIPPFNNKIDNNNNNPMETFNTKKFALEIDRRSRYIFPITFFIFNLFYWIILIVYSNQD